MTPSTERPLRLAAIGDLHVRESHDRPYRELFSEISARADVLALCGDLTNFGKPREAEILADDLRACTIPVVGVLGNHDLECGHGDEVCTLLSHAGVKILDGGEAYEIHGV